MSNQKYEITDITHEKYPFLHRIRALRDICAEVKAGDLGGFVESERNLSFEPGDDAWIFDEAIAAGESCVDKGSILRESAVVCDSAYVSHGSELSGDARAEDDTYIRCAKLSQRARASGCSLILQSPKGKNSPVLSGSCSVYGKVQGDVILSGSVVVLNGETIFNDSLDTLSIDDQGRHILRDPSRDELAPHNPMAKENTKHRRKELER